MRVKDIVLGSIILCLGLNLLANMIWDYLPDKEVHPYTYVVVTIAIVFVCILHIIFGREDSAQGFLTKLWRILINRKAIVFIPYTNHSGFNNYWNNGESNGKPAMQVRGEWYATNRTDESMQILRAYLVKPRTEAWPRTRNSYNEDLLGDYPISPGDVTRVKVTLCIQPPICKEGESFIGKMVFIDQFNKKHKVKATFEFRDQEE